MSQRRREFFKLNNVSLSDKELDAVFQKHGPSLIGLVKEHNIRLNLIEFLDFVSVGAEDVIKPSEEEIIKIKNNFTKLKNRKNSRFYTLTNGSEKHCKKVLKILGISEFFDGHVTANCYNRMLNTEYVCKPDVRVFECCEKVAKFDAGKGDRIFYFEDSRSSVLEAKKRIGWKCFYVVEDEKVSEIVGVEKISTIYEIPKVLKEFF